VVGGGGGERKGERSVIYRKERDNQSRRGGNVMEAEPDTHIREIETNLETNTYMGTTKTPPGLVFLLHEQHRASCHSQDTGTESHHAHAHHCAHRTTLGRGAG